ncbi:response regulator [Chryseobacterium fluminis]|uniref:response regulator n=1 Tax=Chryseobacterium fluminis TaxID=2983606 RepID=UPI00224E76C9|nr:response regulator [Chryseobacterium sp. MMS21-Ot14]UZT97963.1 response regulator [Chryseobacterium sp. MMS21-Ot14]
MPKKTKRNLQFGIGFSLLVLIASSVASYLSIRNQMEHRESVTKSRISMIAVKDILIALIDAETGNRGYQLTGKENFLEPYNRSLQEYPKALVRAKSVNLNDNKQHDRLDLLQKNADKDINTIKIFVEKRRKGILITQNEMLLGKNYMDNCRTIVRDFVQYEEKRLEKRNKDLDSSSLTTILFIVFSSLAAIIVTLFFYFKLRNDLIRRDKLEKELKAKDLEISRRVNVIQQVAGRVSNGDYSQKIADEYDGDLGDLVDSLNHMTDSLKAAFDKINKSDWIQTGLVKLNESLVGNKSVKELSSDSLNQLIDYANCINGAIYLMDDGKLRLSSYSGLEKNMKQTFDPGEGMVGQAFVQKQAKAYNHLDHKDFVATFASSTIKVHAILLIPIIMDRLTFGVIEVSANKHFDQDKIDYFVECSRNIAIALRAARGRAKEQRLLEETQAQSEELQVQHSELENLNTELEAQTQKLQASEEELRVQQEELMQTNTELEERSKLLEEKNQLIAERNIEIQRKAEELALSTQYKSEFLANMSHELRTPLNSILLLSRLMAENPEENLNDDQIESAKVIQSAGSSLLTLIDEILDLAKIESGKMSLEYEAVQISEVVKDLKNLMDPLVNNKGIKFNVSIEDALEKNLETDRLRLDQVLRNLLSNALKFTKQGSVALAIRRDTANKDFIVFSVKDTGIGIPEDKQKIIFEAFQQADGSTQRKFGGTGLGLSISREIAKLLGGRLDLTSKVDEGSEFSLTIPISESVKESQTGLLMNSDQDLIDVIVENVEEIKNTINYDESNVTSFFNHLEIPEDVEDDRNSISKDDKVILIVEDDTNFARALLKFARMQNYKGVVVVRGDQALSAAMEYHPNAILLDIQLPVKDGWQVMEEFKSNPKTRSIPVHMMSSLHVKKESLMKGAIDFINKPVAMEQMTDVFRKIEDALKKSPRKVLIVEENAKHASALSYFLSNFDIMLSVEDTVKDSVNAFNEDRVDCVIFDIGDNRRNAYKIIESIKSYDGLENLPIIIFTEQNLTNSEELKIRQYADSIVVKTAHSYQRILDEVGLFLHLVEEKSSSSEDIRDKTLGSLTEVLSGKKILVTDDDVRNIFSLTKALEKYKVEVIVAMDGIQALKKIEEHPDVDVILMDMMMPNMDGYETIEKIRKIEKFRRLPIISVTAKSMIGDRQKCIDAGASDYITKPVDMDQLLSLLRVWLYQS